MRINLKIIFGGFLVAIAGTLSIAWRMPSIFSPYSAIVLWPMWSLPYMLNIPMSEIPKDLGLVFGILPLTILYYIWTFAFIKRPYVICKPTKYLALILVALSVVFLIANYEEGVIFRGPLYPLVICCLSAILVGCMVILFNHNKRKPSLNTSLGFNVLLFSWLGWIAFPWIGELI